MAVQLERSVERTKQLHLVKNEGNVPVEKQPIGLIREIVIYKSGENKPLMESTLPRISGVEDETLYKRSSKELSAIARERASRPRTKIVKKGEGLITRSGETTPDEMEVRLIETHIAMSEASYNTLKKGVSRDEQIQRYKQAQVLKDLWRKKKLQRNRAEAEKRKPAPRMKLIKKGEGLITRLGENTPDAMLIPLIDTKYSLPQNAVYKKGMSTYEQIERYKLAQGMKKLRKERQQVKDERYAQFFTDHISIHGITDTQTIIPQVHHFLSDTRFYVNNPDILEIGIQKGWKVPENHIRLLERQQYLTPRDEAQRIERTRKEIIKTLIEKHESGMWDRFMLRHAWWLGILSVEIVGNTLLNREEFQKFLRESVNHPQDFIKGATFLALLVGQENIREWYKDHKKPIDLQKEFAPGLISIYEAKRKLPHQQYVNDPRTIVV